MRVFLMVTAAAVALVSGCGQAEPDRYKTKFTERPSKATSTAKEATKEKGAEGGNQPKAAPQEKSTEPAKGK